MTPTVHTDAAPSTMDGAASAFLSDHTIDAIIKAAVAGDRRQLGAIIDGAVIAYAFAQEAETLRDQADRLTEPESIAACGARHRAQQADVHWRTARRLVAAHVEAVTGVDVPNPFRDHTCLEAPRW